MCYGDWKRIYLCFTRESSALNGDTAVCQITLDCFGTDIKKIGVAWRLIVPLPHAVQTESLCLYVYGSRVS